MLIGADVSVSAPQEIATSLSLLAMTAGNVGARSARPRAANGRPYGFYPTPPVGLGRKILGNIPQKVAKTEKINPCICQY